MHGKRAMRLILPALAALAWLPPGATPVLARAEMSVADALRGEIGARAPKELRGFYAARGNHPLWFDANGQPLPAASELLDQLFTASADGLNPRKLKFGEVAKAFERAESGRMDDMARAEIALSRSLSAYVQALRSAPRAPMLYESAALAPAVPTAAAVLDAAAAAPSLDRWVAGMGWMHPFYAPLRTALASPGYSSDQRRTLAINLERVRALPVYASGRSVVIDAASARLWMFDGPRAVDSMRVVVGKVETQTPIMAGFLRSAIANPYWNLPDDLAYSRVTEKVLASGPGYIAANRFQVLASWDDNAPVLDPRKIDWRAVAAGTQTIRARQLPGPGNFMGRVKFLFPNPQGIYLHDTPERDLLTRDARHFSNGCVRLEDAARLGRWLLGRPLPKDTRTPEQRIDLPELVPIHITYLTALPENGRIVFRPDVYGRDGAGAVLASR